MKGETEPWLVVEAYTMLKCSDYILKALMRHGQFGSSKLVDFIWVGGQKLIFINLSDYLIAGSY